MSTLLLKNATQMITMNDQRRRITNGALFVRDNGAGRGVIESVVTTADLELYTADRVIDATGMIILPGLVNTHHHLYQTLTRAIPAAQDAGLFGWLKTLYPIWAGLNGEAIYASALTGLAELMLSGCTTTSDHLYIFPNDARLDDEIRAAQEIGIRFHATRGSMSLGESKGGLPPDRVVEDEAFILKDTQRVIETYHDDRPYAMLRIAVAPCSPFSVTENLMRESARLARAYGVQLHTHLAETVDEEEFCLATSGKRPVGYAESLDWLGDDVWFAHGVHINPAEIREMAHSHTGVAHCPGSNMRLGSGIAPVRAYLDAGVPVGLGVDGWASNDSSHMLAEARLAMLLQRIAPPPSSSPVGGSERGGNPAGLSAEEALWIATRGGADILGRDDIGQLAPGKAADFIGLRLDTLGYAGGAVHDPLAATVFCHSQYTDLSVINGRVVVQDGRLLTIDVPTTVARHNAIARQLVGGQ